MANTADQLQNEAIRKADEYSKQLQTFLELMKAGIMNGGGWTNAVVSNNLDTSAIQSLLLDLINSTQLNPPIPLATPSLPTLVVPTPAKVNADIAIPAFATISLPKLNTPNAPTLKDFTFTGVQPTINTPNAPARPALHLPTAPTFTNVAMPTITDIVMPTLHAIAPVDSLSAPTALFAFSEVAYSSALLDSSKAKLLRDMTHGGYGIETNDEIALWNRAAERELRGAAIASDEVARTMASRGFSLPPGAMLAQLASTQQAATEKLSSVSRDIALKRADMYVENRKFTITEVRELEQILIGTHMSVMERALNASKATVEFGIALYNSRISKFNALMEGYKSNVSAYAEQVRAAVSQLEAQKVKLEVVQTEIGIQKSRAEIYNTQVEGQKAILEMYRTDISAMQGLVDVERLKLDGFRSSVEIFSEQIRAGTLQLQGYEAQTRGNLAQVEVYKAQIGAQLSQAELAKAQASIVESNARVSTENLRAAISSIAASADIYRAQSAGVASANDAQSRAFASRTEAFRAIAQVYDVMGKIQISEADMDMRAAIENLRASIDQIKMVGDHRTGLLSAGAGAIGDAIKSQLGQVLGIASAITTSTS